MPGCHPSRLSWAVSGRRLTCSDSIQLSRNGNHYALVGDQYGTRNRYVYLDNRQGPSCFFTSMPTFSDDGDHFAFAGGSGGTKPLWTIFVDGKPGPTVNEVIEHRPKSWRFTREGKLQALVISDQQIHLLTITPQEAWLTTGVRPLCRAGLPRPYPQPRSRRRLASSPSRVVHWRV